MSVMEALFPADVVPRSTHRVVPGVVHLPDVLSLADQRRLAAGSRDWPGTSITGYGASRRRHVTTIPDWVTDLAHDALADAVGRDDSLDERFAPDGLLIAGVDQGVARRPALRMHRISGAGPVVLLSVGDACEFRIGGVAGTARTHHDILLDSGDVLVWGGPAREAHVGAPRTRPATAPEWCGLTGGWIGVAVTRAG